MGASCSGQVFLPGTGISFEIDGRPFLAMVTAICHEEQHPSFGTAHRIRYIYGQCGREWIWLEGAAKTLTFRHSKNRIPFQLHKLGLWCPTQRYPAKLSSRDVVIQSICWTTSILESFRSSRKMCDYLEAEWPALGLPPAAQVLELGAGNGWLGMTLARNLLAISGKSRILVTERAGYSFQFLKENLDYNEARGVPLDHLQEEVLDWANCQDFDASSFDLLLGTDLAPDPLAAHLLVASLRCFLAQNPRLLVLLAYQPNSGSIAANEAFFQGLHEHGLDYSIVAKEKEGNGSRQPGVAILQIVCQQQDQFLLPWSDALSIEEVFTV
ncbi:unnamed protein product [Effrenium voratum]|nr:unnamed protein product [Effrenium voratum]